MNDPVPGDRFLAREQLPQLLEAIHSAGYECIGPTVRDETIVFEPLVDTGDLPWGVVDDQQPGAYRLRTSDPDRCFAWNNGPQAIKPLVFRPEEVVWRMAREDEGVLHFRPAEEAPPRRAILGVRACDLAALLIQDKHFLQQEYPDTRYRAFREGLLLIAVNCTRAAATCFCVSTGDGPHAQSGHDLALTEIAQGYLLHAHSLRGKELLALLPTTTARAAQQSEALAAMEQATLQERALPSRNLRDLLFERLEHPRWEEVASRCLACGNCTAVCPTCFCNHEFDREDPEGTGSEHLRQWDSCFNPDHAHVHGMHLREETVGQYRQWLTHKLGSWHDQYGRSGCVGCGRCISWCPVGIDLVEEVAALSGDATDA